MPESHPTVRTLCRDAFRRNLVPGIVLQTFALFVLITYFQLPAARPFYAGLGEAKAKFGFLFSAAATALFGGFIPYLILLKRKRIPKGQRLYQGVFFILYWAFEGMVVDLLYTLQGHWFGHGMDLATLIKKVLIDQGPFNLLFATPFSLLMYRWKDEGFSWSRTRRALTLQVFCFRYAAIQVSVWTVWIPAVTMIYMLPPDLQVPLFNIVLCFFTLVLGAVTRKDV